MKRLQRQRTRGWRMSTGAVYVGRPSQWGNPFPINGDVAPWLAVALGERADKAGRRKAAVFAYRAWMTGEPVHVPSAPIHDAVLEYSDGTQRASTEVIRSLAMLMIGKSPVAVPPKPDLEPLRGHDLVRWCPLDGPCHADVLLELVA